MQWLLARLKEPSTWASIAALVGGMTFLPHAGDIASLIPNAGLLVAGILGIVLKDKAS